MADGFKVADAYADFHVNVDQGIDEAKARIRARQADFDQIGKAAGDDYGKGFSGAVSDKITKGPPVMVKADADTALAKAKIKELAASRNAAVIALDADISKAEARIKELAGKRGNTKIDVDAETAKAEAKIAALQAKKGRITLEVDVDKNALAKAGQEVEKATEQVAQRAQAKFAALQFAGAFAGLPVAAMAASVGVGAALALVPAAFVGIAAAALKTNEQVASAFTSLKTNVIGSTQAMSAQMAGPLAGAAGDLGAAFNRLKPQINTAMAGSIPAVHLLTGAVTDFAEYAMPGVVKAVQSSTAPLEGLRSFAGQAGTGVTNMFTNMSAGAQGAKVGLQQTGGIVQDLGGFVGTLLATFANGSAGVLPQFRAVLGQLEGTITTVAHNAMPALQGATSGFSGTVGGMLSIVQGAAGALGSWAAPLGQMGGSLFAVNNVAKLFGTSLGATGFGLKAFASSVDEAGNRTTPFKTAVAGADTAGGKFKAGLSSVVSAGINPMGLALVAGGFLLDAFGQSQQKAAQAATDHRDNVRTLTDSIRADGGLLGEHTAKVNLDALAAKNATSNLAVYGQSLETAKLAIQGNSRAYDLLKNSSGAAIEGIAKSAGLTDAQTKSLVGLGQSALDTGQNYNQLLGDETKHSAAMGITTGVTSKLTDAQRNHLAAIINGNGAVGEQIKSQREAHDAYVLSEMGLQGLTAAQVEARDATNKHTDAIFAEQNAMLGYRGAVLNTKDAMDKYNTAMASGNERAKEKATLDLERAFAAQEQAVYNNAFAMSKSATDDGKKTEALAAMRAETVKLANDFKGTLPQSLQETIGKFSLAEAAAAGMTLGVNNAGQAVYKLPNGKEILISANTKTAEAAIAALPDIAAKTRGTVVISANTDPATGKTNAVVQYADGSTGIITVDANKDPATGKAMMAVQFANGQRGNITIDAFNQGARDRTIEAKRMADGTVAWIVVNANTGAAESQANWAARDRYATINFRAVVSGMQNIANAGANIAATFGRKDGGIVTRGFASGGLASGGSPLDVTGGGLLSGPGGPRTDSILASVSDGEFVNDAASTARNLEALKYANNGGTITPAPRATGTSISRGGDGSSAPTGGATQNFYNTFHMHETDVYTLATLVSRELSLRSKTGASM